MRGLGGAGESSVGASGSGHALHARCHAQCLRHVYARRNASTVHAFNFKRGGYALRVFQFCLPGVSLLDSMTFRPDWQIQRTWSWTRSGRTGSRSAVPESRKRPKTGRNRSTRTRGAVSALSGGWGGRRSSRRGAVALLHGAFRTTPANGAGGGRDSTPVPGRHVTIYYYY